MSAAVLASFRNEFRALLPLWSVCTLTVLATLVIEEPNFSGIAILAYGLGSCALGAHAFGHEYSHRTLPLVLSQPIDRRQVYAIKLATLMMLVSLLGVAGYLTVLPQELDRGPVTPAQAAPVVWAVAVFLAPALTMLCRGTLAGAIFAGTLPGMIAVAGGLIGWYRFDPDAAAIDRFQLAFFWRSMPPLLIAAALVSWRTFMGLEAIEGRGREFHLPQWLRGSSDVTVVRRRHPLWQLIAKELRLQQMVFAICGIYIVIATAVKVRHVMNPAFAADVLIPLTFMYVALLALVAGALASAEERHLRTLEPQLLLPMAASRQWLVKAAVVYGVALTLAVALPTGVMLAVRSTRADQVPWVELLVTVTALASASLYVSSLTTSGVRAVTASAPFIGIGMYLLSWSRYAADDLIATTKPGAAAWVLSRTAEENTRIAAILLVVCFCSLMIRFAHLNHRTGDHSRGRIGAQLAVTAGFIVMAGSVATLVRYLPKLNWL